MSGEVELEIDSRIKLVVQKARRIPISVHNDLKKKIKIKTDNFSKRRNHQARNGANGLGIQYSIN